MPFGTTPGIVDSAQRSPQMQPDPTKHRFPPITGEITRHDAALTEAG